MNYVLLLRLSEDCGADEGQRRFRAKRTSDMLLTEHISGKHGYKSA